MIEGISTNRLDSLYGISFSEAELDTMDFLDGITRTLASVKCRFLGTLNTEARPRQGQVLSSSQSLERLASITAGLSRLPDIHPCLGRQAGILAADRHETLLRYQSLVGCTITVVPYDRPRLIVATMDSSRFRIHDRSNAGVDRVEDVRITVGTASSDVQHARARSFETVLVLVTSRRLNSFLYLVLKRSNVHEKRELRT
ncbi:hypothetical protein QLX08_006678 [Tetragonisca angustula]|uniref:Uncharacterized protein n=1 Tax=Tetragonisca angustula TaxID=166442 RepID=A0AAW0ZSQ6_9HYME